MANTDLWSKKEEITRKENQFTMIIYRNPQIRIKQNVQHKKKHILIKHFYFYFHIKIFGLIKNTMKRSKKKTEEKMQANTKYVIITNIRIILNSLNKINSSK